MAAQTSWTHPSVVALGSQNDPIEVITQRARDLVFEAVENGWSGPPFDPIALAELRGILVEPSADVREARLISAAGTRFTIEFNPERPKHRVRYSIAHELAHTLFEDVAERIRYRKRKQSYEEDHWQLETLCDIAAAEILMPVGDGGDLQNTPVDIDAIIDLQKQYEVSAEAALLRVVKLTNISCAAFAAARVDETPGHRSAYRIDYGIGSRGWQQDVSLRSRTVRSTILAQCTAVGYTAKGEETWWSRGDKLRVECVGAPPFPESIYPRVVGVLLDSARPTPQPDIKYLVGDATDPAPDGKRVIAHIVNDKTPNWGAGFGKAVATKFPAAQAAFKRWAADENNLRLGECYFTEIENDLITFQMIAQRGYRSAGRPLIRYQALESCLRQLAAFAAEQRAAVHMPFIGTGHAGGNWALVEELIREQLIGAGIPVTVYGRPGQVRPKGETSSPPEQSRLSLTFDD